MKKFLILAASAALITGSAYFASAEEVAKTEGQQPKKGGMMGEMDANGDGKVSKDEFVADAAKKYSEIDSNKDNNITHEEMQAHHKAKKAKHEAMEKEHEAERDKRFKEMDKDGDGKISKEEMMPSKPASEEKK
jgi:Ca2+-binding EF-hand superfamily protein